ncbi:hypothetical protein Goshw_003091, partial [Gossypium schwendimanii]|nr:hypothetical protein [Gossypium schwendimanii]
LQLGLPVDGSIVTRTVHIDWRANNTPILYPYDINFRKAGKLSWASVVLATFYARVPKELRDIRLLLDQQFKAEFVWTPYKDPTIKNASRRNSWFRQSIPMAPQDLDDLHLIDLRGRPDEN